MGCLFFINPSKLLFQQQIAMRKVQSFLTQFADIRPVSPIKSPIKTVIRPVSPFRNQNAYKQIAMSPLRIRNSNMLSSRTPTKAIPIKRAQTEREPVSRNEAKHMENTIKNGMGLFQQLAYKNKLASDRKENQMMAQNSKPSEFETRSRETVSDRFHEKNSFGALLQNVKEIQSIQAYKINQKSNSTIQRSFRAVEKSKPIQNTVKVANAFSNIPQLSSFGIDQEILSQKKTLKPETTELKYKKSDESRERESMLRQDEEIAESYGDIYLLIKKASEATGDSQHKYNEEAVKISYQVNDESLSMSPYF